MTPEQRRQRVVWWIAGIVGGLAVLVLVAGLVQYLRATGEPPLPDDAIAGIGDGSGGRQANEQLARVLYAIHQGRRERVNLELSNTDISNLIGHMGGGGGNVRELQVYLGSGRVIGRGRATYQGHDFNVQVALRLAAENGGLQAQIDEMWIGGLKGSDSMKRQLQGRLSAELARQTPAKIGVYVETIGIEPGRATITGYTMGR